MLHWKGWGGPEKDVVLGKSPSPPDKMIPNEQNLEPLKRVAARRQLTPSAGVAAEGRAAMGTAAGHLSSDLQQTRKGVKDQKERPWGSNSRDHHSGRGRDSHS